MGIGAAARPLRRIGTFGTAYPPLRLRRAVRRAAIVGLLAILGLAVPTTWVALAAGNTGQGPITVTALAAPGGVASAELAMPDPDLAPLVGHVAGPSLLGVPLGEAHGRAVAVPSDAPADLGALQPTGRHFAFTDPHGHAWDVQEYRAAWGYAYATPLGPTTHDDAAGDYNFVLIVDRAHGASWTVRLAA